MKLPNLILFFVVIETVKSGNSSLKANNREVFIKDESSKFSFPNLIESENGKSESLREPLSIRVSNVESSEDYHLKMSSVLLFDSIQNFKETVKSIKWLSNKRFRYPHLVYVPGLTTTDIENIIVDGFPIDHVSFLVNESNGSIDLASSFMFTPKKCHVNQVEVINKFSRNNSRWETSNFYPNKYDNFHDCSLRIAFEGSIKIFDFLASALNYSEDYVANNPNDKKIDIISKLRGFDGDKEHISGDTFIALSGLVAVPPGEPYSPFEKMFIMFDIELWIGIVSTFVIALVTIQVINRCSIKVQKFVFGRDVQTPTLNVFSIFLAGAQYRVPGRNFARFLLILFLVWSLIIRTCYQSKMFEYLQADIRKPGPRLYEDINLPRGTDSVNNMTRYNGSQHGDDKNRTMYLLCTEKKNKNCLELSSDPVNKIFTFTTPAHLRYIYAKQYRSGVVSFKVLKEHLRQYFMSYTFQLYNPFFETFNRKFGLMISSGLASQLQKILVKLEDINRKEEAIGPQVLTVEHLAVGFYIWLTFLAISTFVFLVELSIPWTKKKYKSFRRKLATLSLLRAFLEAQPNGL